MTDTLTIGRDGFALPLTLVTSTQAILARKRSGKSYLASVEAEELLARKQQIAVIDPTGAWWGLRSSADGEGEGFPIVVFGGDHADAPLDFRAGKEMAAAQVEHGFSAIYDVGNWVTDEQIQFVMDFCAELLRISREAIHVFMDEADTFAPQILEGRLQKQCLGTVSRLVKQGGVRGVGFTMITQRPADMNKKVLSQVDILTVLRMSHPLDVGAAFDWIQSEVSVEFAKEVKAALPSLPVGTAFFCSAALGIGGRVEVRQRNTFNSGATPKPGERKAEPKVMAAIDVAKLGKEIAESARVAKENSVDGLKAEVARLQKLVSEKGEAMQNTAEFKALEQEVGRLRARVAELEMVQNRTIEMMSPLVDGLHRSWIEVSERLAKPLTSEDSVIIARDLNHLPAKVFSAKLEEIKPLLNRAFADSEVAKTFSVPQDELRVASGNLLGMPERKVLNALARLRAVGVTAPRRLQVALFGGYSNEKSGGFARPTATLNQMGLVESSNGTLSLTADGVAAVGGEVKPATTLDLHNQLHALLGNPEWRLLQILIENYPDAVTREDLAAQAGYSNVKSGGFARPLAKLVELDLAAHAGVGKVVGTKMLFVNGKR